MQHKTIELRLHAALGLPAAGTVVVVEVRWAVGLYSVAAVPVKHTCLVSRPSSTVGAASERILPWQQR